MGPNCPTVVSTLLSTFLLQFCIRDLWQLRDEGRIETELLICKAHLIPTETRQAALQVATTFCQRRSSSSPSGLSPVCFIAFRRVLANAHQTLEWAGTLARSRSRRQRLVRMSPETGSSPLPLSDIAVAKNRLRLRARARGSRHGILICSDRAIGEPSLHPSFSIGMDNAQGFGTFEGPNAPDRKSGYDCGSIGGLHKSAREEISPGSAREIPPDRFGESSEHEKLRHHLKFSAASPFGPGSKALGARSRAVPSLCHLKQFASPPVRVTILDAGRRKRRI